MTHSSSSLSFQTTSFSPDLSDHALLSAAHQFAQDLGFLPSSGFFGFGPRLSSGIGASSSTP
jgi:hypothetical protein